MQAVSLANHLQIGGAYLAGLEGAVWGLAISVAINWLLCHFSLRIETRRYNIPFSFTGGTQELGILWKFSLPATLSALMVGPVNWTCDAMLVNQNYGYSSMGVYSAAISISLVVASLNSVIGSAFFPVCVSQLNKIKNNFEFLNIIGPWAIGIIIVCPIIFLHELPQAMFGKAFAGEQFKTTLLLVMGFTLIIAHRQGISRNFAAAGYQWYSLFGNLLWGILAIFLAYLFKEHGSNGRAASFLIAYVANTIIFVPLYIKLKLCSSKLLFSKWCIYIWLILAISFLYIYLFELHLFFRTILLICTLFITYYCMRNMYFDQSKKE